VREKRRCVGGRKGSHGVVEIKLLGFRWLSLLFKCVKKGLPGFTKIQATFLLMLRECISTSIGFLMSRSMYPVLHGPTERRHIKLRTGNHPKESTYHAEQRNFETKNKFLLPTYLVYVIREPEYWSNFKEPATREDKTLTRSQKTKTHGYVVK